MRPPAKKIPEYYENIQRYKQIRVKPGKLLPNWILIKKKINMSLLPIDILISLSIQVGLRLQ